MRRLRYVKLTDLTIQVTAWAPGRLPPIRRALASGRALPPVIIGIQPDGRQVLVDGNHRIIAHRDHGARRILVEYRM